MDIENQIKTLNDEILVAEEDGNDGPLKECLAHNFRIIRASGVRQDRGEYLADVPKNAHRGRSSSNAEVQLFDNCAFFTCIVATTQNSDGSPNPGQFWNTRLFIKDDGDWHCFSWQVTKIP